MSWSGSDTTQRLAVFGEAAMHELRAEAARNRAARIENIAAIHAQRCPDDEVDVDLAWELDVACE